MHVNHRRFHLAMPEQWLHFKHGIAILNEMRRKRMAEHMRMHSLLEFGFLPGFFENLPDALCRK